jgi:hypothetical protein
MIPKTNQKTTGLPVMLTVTLFLLWGLNSCQKSGTTSFTDLPVVEAYLSPGEKISIKITQKAAFEDGTAVPSINLDALGVYVVSGGNEYMLIPTGSGVYTDTSGIITVTPDSTYILHMNYNGTDVSSTTIIPSKPTSVTQSATSITMSQFDPDNPGGSTHPDPVEITFANADASYYLTTVECMDTTQVPVYKDSIPANDMFSSQPVTGTEIEIEPMRIRYFGLNRIILYHINPEYSTFFMRQASTSQSYQEPPTNIVNGLGIFTGINADTLYLNVIQQK